MRIYNHNKILNKLKEFNIHLTTEQEDDFLRVCFPNHNYKDKVLWRCQAFNDLKQMYIDRQGIISKENYEIIQILDGMTKIRFYDNWNQIHLECNLQDV
jgi:hypothetical protein